MSSEWPLIRLGDVIELTTGFPFKSADYTDTDDGIRLLRGDNIAQGLLRWDGAKRWSLASMQEMDRYLLREGDIVLAMDRPWISAGLKFASIGSSDLPALLVQRVARIRPQSDIAPSFLHCVIASLDFSQYIQNVTTGTAVPHISAKQICDYQFRCPDAVTRKACGQLVMALNDRIALLRETNATLEAIAQALFKSWFVDFDPVHAKARGEQPQGMDDATAALFPASFEESELGIIPKGWRVGSLGDELKIAYGKNLPTVKLLDSGFPVFGGNGQIGYYSQYLYEQRQVLVACRGAASGKVNQSIPRSFVTNNSLVLESNDKLPFGYLKGFMSISDLSAYVTGSAQPQVTIDNLKVFKIVIPNKSIVEAFEDVSIQIETRVQQNNDQAQTLAQLRDTLLPKLISGQLRLPEAEALLAEALP